jgi:hypothetical protein
VSVQELLVLLAERDAALAQPGLPKIMSTRVGEEGF